MIRYLFWFVLSTQFCFSQMESRKSMQGRIISDSTKVEDVIIFNVNSKTAKTLNPGGFFEIEVRANDTLLFSGLLFKSKKVILTEKLLKDKLLIVELEPNINELDEVLINNKRLNPIVGGSQRYVDQQFFDDGKSSPKNQFVYDGSITNGINFIRLFSDIAKIFKKKEAKKATFVSDVDFSEFALRLLKKSFFTATLGLKDHEIKLFLFYCENDAKAKSIVETKSEFELMDFLVIKAKDFKEFTIKK